MKLKEKKELLTKTDAELRTLLSETQDELLQLRLDHARGKLKNTSALRKGKRKIAVLLTILPGKELSSKRQELQHDPSTLRQAQGSGS